MAPKGLNHGGLWSLTCLLLLAIATPGETSGLSVSGYSLLLYFIYLFLYIFKAENTGVSFINLLNYNHLLKYYSNELTNFYENREMGV